MRATGRLSSLVVILVGMNGGCLPVEDPPPDTVAPAEPLAPPPALSPPQGIPAFNAHEQVTASPANALSRAVRRLFFQCTDEVTFAVQSFGRRLAMFPPGHSNGYIVLTQQPSDSGLYYTGGDAELRMDGDLATLQVGRDRYVDCVSNPAAATWEDPRRGGTPAR
jgi:membrane-bound inhibitor of C-type lysozyme